MKFIALALIVGVVLLGYAAIYFMSTARHDPKVWHIDPLTAPASSTPNDYRVAPIEMTDQRVDREAPVYTEKPHVLAQAFDNFALNQRGTVRIAGLPAELMMTYVQTSENIGAPDYITIRFIEVGDGQSTVAIYSRSRFGYGDLGVNKRRVESWLKTMEAFEKADA